MKPRQLQVVTEDSSSDLRSMKLWSGNQSFVALLERRLEKVEGSLESDADLKRTGDGGGEGGADSGGRTRSSGSKNA